MPDLKSTWFSAMLGAKEENHMTYESFEHLPVRGRGQSRKAGMLCMTQSLGGRGGRPAWRAKGRVPDDSSGV